MLALLSGSTCSRRMSRVVALDDRKSGSGNTPDLIFRNSVGTWSSSKGSVPLHEHEHENRTDE